MRRLFVFLNLDSIIRYGFIVSFLVLMTDVFFLLIKYSSFPPEVPLFYSRPWGDEQLGTPLKLSILPVSALLIFIINNYLSYKLVSRWLLLSRVLTVGATAISLLTFIALYKIITLVS